MPSPLSTSYAVSPNRAIQTRPVIPIIRFPQILPESGNSDAPLQFPASNFHTGTLNRAIWTHPVIPIIQFPQSLSESSNSNAHCHSHHPLPTQFLQNEQFRRAPSFSLLGFHASSLNRAIQTRPVIPTIHFLRSLSESNNSDAPVILTIQFPCRLFERSNSDAILTISTIRFSRRPTESSNLDAPCHCHCSVSTQSLRIKQFKHTLPSPPSASHAGGSYCIEPSPTHEQNRASTPGRAVCYDSRREPCPTASVTAASASASLASAPVASASVFPLSF